MFAFHRKPKNPSLGTVILGLEMNAGMFICDRPLKTETERIGRLYDLAHFCSGIREEIAWRTIDRAQRDSLLAMIDRIEFCFDAFFFDVVCQPQRGLAFDALRKLVKDAHGEKPFGKADDRQIAFARAHLLQNIAHNEHLRWRIGGTEKQDEDATLIPEPRLRSTNVLILFPDPFE